MMSLLRPRCRRAVAASALVIAATACSSSTPDADTSDTSAADTTSVDTSNVDTSSVDTPNVDTPSVETSPTDSTTADTAEPTDTSTAEGSVADGQTSFVVESTTADYFILWVRPDAASDREVPVAVVRGEDGSTTITDHRQQLPEDRYRVETASVANPGDVDDDGIDDLTELDDPVGSNPLNGAPAMDSELGAVNIPDQETFELLSYQGNDVARDSYLAGLEFVKFWIVDTDTDNPKVYFMNTNNYNAHPRFAEQIGLGGGRGPQPGKMRGDIVFSPDDVAPDGTIGRFRFAFQPNDAYSYDEIALAYEALVNSMPSLGGKLFYYPFPQSALPLYEAEIDQYATGRVPVLVDPVD